MYFQQGIQSGWVNECGIELFTLGWVQCPQAAGPGPLSWPEKEEKIAHWQDEQDLLDIIRFLASKNIL